MKSKAKNENMKIHNNDLFVIVCSSLSLGAHAMRLPSSCRITRRSPPIVSMSYIFELFDLYASRGVCLRRLSPHHAKNDNPNKNQTYFNLEPEFERR